MSLTTPNPIPIILTNILTFLTFFLLPLTTAISTSGLTASNVSTSAHNASSSAAQNGCYRGGAQGNKAWINDHIDIICEQTFGGWYQKDWMGRTACYNTNQPHGPGSYFFAIYNMDKVEDRFMDWHGCVTYMKHLNTGCAYGGDMAFWDINWRFILDPEAASWCAGH